MLEVVTDDLITHRVEPDDAIYQTARGEKSGIPVESNIWFVFEPKPSKLPGCGSRRTWAN